jgi:hypothetical protein
VLRQIAAMLTKNAHFGGLCIVWRARFLAAGFDPPGFDRWLFLLGVQSIIFFVALGQAGRCCLCVLFVKWHTLALGVVFFGRALMG